MTEQIPQTQQPRLGEVSHGPDGVTLRYERRLDHAPEKVWRALTESEHLRHWFPADIEGERRAGAPLVLRFWPEHLERAREELESGDVSFDDPTLPGQLLTWDPPRVFELTWDTDLLRFELEPDGSGTRLVFTTRLATEGPAGVEGTAAGYHVCLDSLAEVLDTGTSQLPAPQDIKELEERYAAAVGG